MKGYIMELTFNCTYCYLFVEKATLKATLDTYEAFTGKRPKYAHATKKSNKIAADSEYAKEFCVNI